LTPVVFRDYSERLANRAFFYLELLTNNIYLFYEMYFVYVNQ